MIQRTITLDKLPTAWKNEIKQNKDLTLKAQQNTGREALRLLIAATPEDQGIMKAGWEIIFTPEGIDIVNTAPHAVFVEKGTRPHWPPREPIRAWVVRHIGKLGNMGYIDPSNDKSIDKLTYLICRKIGQEGTKPHFILQNRQGVFTRILKREVERLLSTK